MTNTTGQDTISTNLNEDGQKVFVVRGGKKVQKVIFGVNRKKARGKSGSVAYSGMDQLRASMSQIKGAKKRKVKMRMILKKRAKAMKIRAKLNIVNRNPGAARMMRQNREMRAKIHR